jgi:hypothetical protein
VSRKALQQALKIKDDEIWDLQMQISRLGDRLDSFKWAVEHHASQLLETAKKRKTIE